jgi:hypothetical protein
MLDVLTEDIVGLLFDNGYKRYPKDIYKPIIPLRAIFFFVKERDVIILEFLANENTTILSEYRDLDESIIREIEKL